MQETFLKMRKDGNARFAGHSGRKHWFECRGNINACSGAGLSRCLQHQTGVHLLIQSNFSRNRPSASINATPGLRQEALLRTNHVVCSGRKAQLGLQLGVAPNCTWACTWENASGSWQKTAPGLWQEVLLWVIAGEPYKVVAWRVNAAADIHVVIEEMKKLVTVGHLARC